MTDWVLFWALLFSVLGPYAVLAGVVGVSERRRERTPVASESDQ